MAGSIFGSDTVTAAAAPAVIAVADTAAAAPAVIAADGVAAAASSITAGDGFSGTGSFFVTGAGGVAVSFTVGSVGAGSLAVGSGAVSLGPAISTQQSSTILPAQLINVCGFLTDFISAKISP